MSTMSLANCRWAAYSEQRINQPTRIEGMSNVRTMAAPMTMARFIRLTPTLDHSEVDAQARSTRQIVLKQELEFTCNFRN